MPAKSKPLKAVPPKQRPASFPDGAWEFPKRLERLAAKHGWDQAEARRIAGVDQATISRWMHYASRKPNPAAVRKLEIEGKAEIGSLLRDPADDGIKTPRSVVLEQFEEWADRMGVHDSIVASWGDEGLGATMKQFSAEVRGAILGLVHLHRVPLPRAIDIARTVLRAHPKLPRGREPNELYWFSLFVPEAGKKESGEFPSSNHIKLVE